MSEEPKLSRLDYVRQQIASGEGAAGKTVKIDIGQHDVYVKLTWVDGRMVRLDMTVSAGMGDDGIPACWHNCKSPERSHYHPLEASRYDIVRMWIESECQLASDLLASGVVEVEYLIEWWKGRRGWPSGYSQKMEFKNHETGQLQPMPVKGPFDALSKLFAARIERWRDEFRVPLTNAEPKDTLNEQDTVEDGGGGQDERTASNGISDGAGGDGDTNAGREGE